MPTSFSYNYTRNRDQIITRALRIIGAIGQGETPSAEAISEASDVLNDMVKEWESDGMQLWCVREYTLTPTATINSYLVGVNFTIDAPAPNKLLQAWSRNTTTSLDTPILLITRQEYNMLSGKTTTGAPSQLWYNPPGEISGSEASGTCTIYVTPDAGYAASNVIMFTGVRPLQDYDASTDVLDFPQYWYNAVTRGLASELADEYGVGLSERGLLENKADKARNAALSYGTEEGHLLIQPAPMWRAETW